MIIYFLLFWLAILSLIVHFFYMKKRKSSTESNSNNNIDLVRNIELESNFIKSEDSTETVFPHPNKNQNSFLNPNDDFGSLIKGVVLDNQAYEYEVSDNDCSNFSIIELGDKSKEISE